MKIKITKIWANHKLRNYESILSASIFYRRKFVYYNIQQIYEIYLWSNFERSYNCRMTRKIGPRMTNIMAFFLFRNMFYCMKYNFCITFKPFKTGILEKSIFFFSFLFFFPKLSGLKLNSNFHVYIV